MGSVLDFNKPLEPFIPAALAASGVGAWEYDVLANCCRGDAMFARIYGLSALEASEGVPIERIAELVHPLDRAVSRAKRQQMLKEGGLYVIELRIVPAHDRVTWLLVRGRYEKDATGRVVQGRGISIDLTESKGDGFVDGQAYFISPLVDLTRETAAERAARFALATHRAVEEMRSPEAAYLGRLMNLVLLEMGRLLSRRDHVRGGRDER